MTPEEELTTAQALRQKFYRGLAGPSLRWDQLSPEQQQRWLNRAKARGTRP